MSSVRVPFVRNAFKNVRRNHLLYLWRFHANKWKSAEIVCHTQWVQSDQHTCLHGSSCFHVPRKRHAHSAEVEEDTIFNLSNIIYVNTRRPVTGPASNKAKYVSGAYLTVSFTNRTKTAAQYSIPGRFVLKTFTCSCSSSVFSEVCWR